MWELVWFVAALWGVLKGVFKLVWFWVLDRVRWKGRRGVLTRGIAVEMREEEIPGKRTQVGLRKGKVGMMLRRCMSGF